jgi:type II secretory pathway component PulF
MKFKYQAKTKEGETQVGFVEAGNRDGAANILANHSLFVLSIEEAGTVHWYDRISAYFERARWKDLVLFTRQLSTLLAARLPLNNALKILYDQTANTTLKEAVLVMSEDIDSGLSFSQAMERQGNIFPSFYVEMMRAAEVTGNMNETAGFLADYTERESILAVKASSALVYPAVILALFIVVAFIMVTFVFPQVGAVFAQNGVALPWYTQALLGSGDFLSKWWPAFMVAVVILGGVILDYFRTDEGIALLDSAKINFSLTKKIYIPLAMARFGNAMALLIHGGIPIAQALEIIKHMVGNVSYEEVIGDVANEVRQGELLSKSIAKYPDFFPDIVSQMAAVGETTGKTEDMFTRIANIYTREADAIMNNLVDIIQPALMIGMGIMVGFLFAAILVPIYRLTASIQ